MSKIITKAEEGKYLTFTLDHEEYGLEIVKVREIIGIMQITKVPKAPDYVRGVINLRGSVIPVIELRKKFEMKSIEDTDETCIIVVDIEKEGKTVQIGVIVDSVSEVLDIGKDAIESAPSFGNDLDTEYIIGMAKHEDGVKILLDIKKVLTKENIENISSLEAEE